MKVVRKVHGTLEAYGIDGQKFVTSVVNTPRFLATLLEFRRRSNEGSLGFSGSHLTPILSEFSDQAGTASGHYFHQDIWAARKILEARPARHIDIGSRVDGFVAHVLVFMPVTIIDIRPLTSNVSGLTFIQGDATHLAGVADNSIDSLSSLHAIEHFGLGRYGDPVDPNACFSAMDALARVLRPGGRLYFSTPIGIERVNFNAHRVFAPSTILSAFHRLSLVSFAAVNDLGDYVDNSRPRDYENSRFACGLFEFTKH